MSFDLSKLSLGGGFAGNSKAFNALYVQVSLPIYGLIILLISMEITTNLSNLL